MKVCSLCNKNENEMRIIKHKTKGLLCSICYQREMSNPITYPLPEHGVIDYSPDGKPICHICGKAYNKVIAHVWQVHNVTAQDYKTEFGLDLGKGIMSDESTELARQNALDNYDVVIKENLLEKGRATRYKPGDPGRTKDQVSEQTRLELTRRLRSYEQERRDAYEQERNI